MASEAIEAFIARWQGRVGGQERANYALFLTELADVLGAPRPEPASVEGDNDYVFERVVRETLRDGSVSHRRIDLYRRGCFVLEAKQSRWPGTTKAMVEERGPAPATPGRRGADKAWDVLMMNARNQAERYVRWLPEGHEPPPFVIVCDVGHCLELYANFRKDGKAYDQFPDRQGFRVYLEDLRRPEIRDRLARAWSDPQSLDPTRQAARVTRAIAGRLAAVSRQLETRGHEAEEVAQFLMRLLFTMFAQSVELIPKGAFSALLAECEADPALFEPMVGQLWRAMDTGDYAFALKRRVSRFNGAFFKDPVVIPLEAADIAELRAAAAFDWREVEPAIFGALLEKALDPAERRSLGAHYTPRAYVERLVLATVIEPLRADWAAALGAAERLRGEGRIAQARGVVAAFHRRLCSTRVLDPACGTGNFLYVTLEMMKRLEGEALEALADLGGQEGLSGLEGHTVDLRQLLGLEKNPRAASIAELVLWIGYLQWHARTRGGAPGEPILRAFGNITVGDAVLAEGDGPPRRPDWPEAEFIVGNPPFIGGKDIRERLGTRYAEALWAAHPHMNESADFVMYWWDRAAERLTADGTPLRRFGFVTTNSISQLFQRRTLQRHMEAERPVALVMAIPDHPWTKAAPDSAAVRIAMTVAEAGAKDGALRRVTREDALDTDAPTIELAERVGRINADLTVGADVTKAAALRANDGLCCPGVKLHGSGFIVAPAQALAWEEACGAVTDKRVRPYLGGRDLTARPRDRFVIDLLGVDEAEIRRRWPELYQHLLATVKPERDRNNRATYRDQWWLHGEPRRELRPALEGLPRFIATTETAKHRVFQFLDAAVLPDNMVVAVASDCAFHLGVLSSRIHVLWALAAGGRQGIGNDPRYSKSRCFDPFPFPVATSGQQALIAALAEEIDGHRRRVLGARPRLTVTALYNVRERLRAGARPGDLTPDERRVFDDGLVLLLDDLHDRLDRAVAAAYGWPAEASAEEALARLVALNWMRRTEEARGRNRWLRPEHQAQRFAPPA
ncbi:class I SAM-dependent DNA methyltransferase, partial [Methylopila musalis]